MLSPSSPVFSNFLINFNINMKSLYFILTILTTCVIVDNELGDIKTMNKPLLNILIKSVEGLQKLECEENCPYIEIYPNINENSAKYDIFNSSNLYSTRDKTICYNTRAATRNFNEDMLFICNLIVYDIQNSLIELLNFKLDYNNYYLRLKWFYLGKYLTTNKYSPPVHVPTGKITKCPLLICMLLFMCGDTGTSINPGPSNQHNLNVCEIVEDSYLNDIDPDMNYFNETELTFSNFKSYTVDEFTERTFNSKPSFNILHHNCRSIMSKDKLDHYEYFLDMLGNPFDIIGLTETWLNTNTVNSPIFKDYNYNHVYDTRPLDKSSECKNEGGGVSLFIRDCIAFKQK